MFRNLFALFSTLMLSAGAASASTADSTKLPLEERIQAAQKTIDTLIDVHEEQDSKSSSGKMAYWPDWHNSWKNWGNGWGNGWNNWGNGWNKAVIQAPKGTTSPGVNKPPASTNQQNKSNK
jgi:rSAM-associated Gly-rich repeat protein